ncbi:MAG: hypothetical protein PHH47_07195 [Gallionella sp.]|nr:hypothetical protein [Gallionella sp.]MDD4947879.1 hypothetical protein [Gallionella sp.]
MSKYQFTESDIYLPGSDIPKNRLGIEAPDVLHEVEATLLQQAYTRFITELDSTVCFDEAYFKSLHRDTFSSLYEWAGLNTYIEASILCVQRADSSKLQQIILQGLQRMGGTK